MKIEGEQWIGGGGGGGGERRHFCPCVYYFLLNDDFIQKEQNKMEMHFREYIFARMHSLEYILLKIMRLVKY